MSIRDITAQALATQAAILQAGFGTSFDLPPDGPVDSGIVEAMRTIATIMQEALRTTLDLTVTAAPIEAAMVAVLKLQNQILQAAYYTTFDIDGASADMPVMSAIVEQLRLQSRILQEAHYTSFDAIGPNGQMNVDAAIADMCGRNNDVLQEVHQVNLGALPLFITTPPYGFSYTPPFSIYRSSVGSYSHSFDPSTLKPASTSTIYVGGGGDNTQDGSTWALRLRSLKQALIVAAALGSSATPRILVQAGTYRYSHVDGSGIQDSFAGQYYDGHLIVEPCDASGNVIAGGVAASRRIISMHDEPMPGWILVSSGVYVSTYGSAVVSPGCIDLSILDGKGNPQALLYAPPATSYANEAAIVSGVAALASQYGLGACWNDVSNGKYYVRTADNRPPDSNIVVMRGGTNTNGANARNLYLGGRYQGVAQVWTRDVHLWGGCPIYLGIYQGGGESRGITYISQDSSTLYSCINGVNVDGAGTFYLLRHASDYSYKDGYNYDQSSGLDPSGTGVLIFHELDCTADWNGNSSQSDDSDNGSSCHMRITGVRVNTIARRTLNRAFHDIQAAKTWNLGCIAQNCRQTGTPSGAFVAGYLLDTGETTQVWLDGCQSVGNAYALEAYKGAILYHANMTTTGYLNDTDGGTITTYNSPPIMPGAPWALTATPQSSSTVLLTFGAPFGVTSYEYRLNGSGSWLPLAGNNIVTGLSPNTAYAFEVRGVNADGFGLTTNSATATTSSGVANIITNGDFSSGTTGWAGFGFSGKSVSGGKATFAASPAFDGINQGSLTIVAGKYYEITYDLVWTSGTVYPFFSGGSGVSGTIRSTSGTFVERILANTGNNNYGMQAETGPATLTIDNITVIGPYNTSTVGGG